MAIQDDAKQFFLTELSRSQGDLPSLQLEWLASEGYTRGSIDERWSYYLRDNGQPPTGVSWDLLGLTRNKGGGAAPPGFGFLLTDDGDYLTDPDGNRYIVESDMGNVSLNTYLANLPDLNIAVIGDSHAESQAQSALAIGDVTGVFGIEGLVSPLDRMWDGVSGDAATWIANSNVNVTTGTKDPNVTKGSNMGTPLTKLTRVLRQAFPTRCGIIRLANLALGGSSSYSWAGELAGGYVGAVSNANDGDTVTLGSVTYTFRASVSVANDVLIGGSANDSNRNLSYAVNKAGGTEGTTYGTGTVANPDVFCPNPASTQYAQYFHKATGTAGNATVIASSTTARISAVTASLVPTLSTTMTGGSATSAIWTNALARLNAGAGMVPDVFLVSLGTNDADRIGWRGVGFEAEMQILLDNIRVAYPSVPIVLQRPPATRGGATPTNALTNIIVPAIDDLIADNTGVYLGADMWTLGLGTGNTSIINSNGTHMTSYGQDLWVQGAAKGIARSLGWMA